VKFAPCSRSALLNPLCAAGQERFRTLTSAYYRGAHGIILGQFTRRANRVRVTLCPRAVRLMLGSYALYLSGSLGSLLACHPVYDITARESFENLQHWLSEVDIYSTNEACVKLLVANKIDEAASRTVSKKEGMQFAREHNMLFIEASAKTQDGIAQAFDELMQKILDVPALLADEGAQGSGGAGGAGSGSSSMRLDRDSDQHRHGGGSCGGFCA